CLTGGTTKRPRSVWPIRDLSMGPGASCRCHLDVVTPRAASLTAGHCLALPLLEELAIARTLWRYRDQSRLFRLMCDRNLEPFRRQPRLELICPLDDRYPLPS